MVQEVPLEVLVANYQATGSDADFQPIAARCKRLVQWMARGAHRRWHRHDTTQEDCEALAWSMFYEAVRTYRAGAGTKFTSWACTMIRYGLLREMVQRVRTVARETSLDLERPGDGWAIREAVANPRAEDPVKMAASREWADRAWPLVDRRCTKREAAILRQRFIEGATLDDIGRRHGFSRERARQILAGALDRLRRASEEN